MAISTINTNSLGASQVTPSKLSQPLTSGNAVASTSGTSIDFTGIPSWVKRITVMFSGVSTNGTSLVQIQTGSGSFETSSYSSSAAGISGAGSATSTNNITSGFVSSTLAGAADTRSGSIRISNITGNTWVAEGCINSGGNTTFTAGTKTLSGTLDRVRITTVNGTDTFDAGSINILYE